MMYKSYWWRLRQEGGRVVVLEGDTPATAEMWRQIRRLTAGSGQILHGYVRREDGSYSGYSCGEWYDGASKPRGTFLRGEHIRRGRVIR